MRSRQTAVAGVAGLRDARLVRINFVKPAVFQRREIRHEHIRAALQAEFAAVFFVDRRQRRRRRNVRIRPHQPRQRNGFIDHQLAVRNLLAVRPAEKF